MRLLKEKRTPAEDAIERQGIARLVSAVKDEAHWQTILEKAETPESKAELERVVGPMLAFRKAAPCTTPDCVSGLHGTWRPVLVVRSQLEPTSETWCPLENLSLCKDCKEDAAVEDFLTETIQGQILAQCNEAGILPPTWRMTTLSWDRVH